MEKISSKVSRKEAKYPTFGWVEEVSDKEVALVKKPHMEIAWDLLGRKKKMMTASRPSEKKKATSSDKKKMIELVEDKASKVWKREAFIEKESKRMLEELIRLTGRRFPNDAIRALPLYTALGAQAFCKYFSLKYKEFTTHGGLEDLINTNLASTITIRAVEVQMKTIISLEKLKQQQQKLLAEASKSNEHKNALKGSGEHALDLRENAR
ncbi:hypothetical protein Adt_35291 [Abeliophyllum distichum]|uniref:Uncharacterized protein n=1 Tax=Abeliophyllum distichum TaxID=126358 RepID=A0ABD1QEA7_9LAMI